MKDLSRVYGYSEHIIRRVLTEAGVPVKKQKMRMKARKQKLPPQRYTDCQQYFTCLDRAARGNAKLACKSCTDYRTTGPTLILSDYYAMIRLLISVFSPEGTRGNASIRENRHRAKLLEGRVFDTQKNLHRLRCHLEKMQKQMADHYGITPSAWQAYESGRSSMTQQLYDRIMADYRTHEPHFTPETWQRSNSFRIKNRQKGDPNRWHPKEDYGKGSAETKSNTKPSSPLNAPSLPCASNTADTTTTDAPIADTSMWDMSASSATATGPTTNPGHGQCSNRPHCETDRRTS